MSSFLNWSTWTKGDDINHVLLHRKRGYISCSPKETSGKMSYKREQEDNKTTWKSITGLYSSTVFLKQTARAIE